MVVTKELQCQEGASGIVKYDCAIYFPRTCLGLYDFLGINFLLLTIRVIIALKKTA